MQMNMIRDLEFLSHADARAHTHSIDSRERNVKFGTHSAIASDLGERLFFAIDDNNNKNARLRIKSVRDTDGGVYRCRVDFFNSATRNSRFNLTLVGRCLRLAAFFTNALVYFIIYVKVICIHRQLSLPEIRLNETRLKDGQKLIEWNECISHSIGLPHEFMVFIQKLWSFALFFSKRF